TLFAHEDREPIREGRFLELERLPFGQAFEELGGKAGAADVQLDDVEVLVRYQKWHSGRKSGIEEDGLPAAGDIAADRSEKRLVALRGCLIESAALSRSTMAGPLFASWRRAAASRHHRRRRLFRRERRPNPPHGSRDETILMAWRRTPSARAAGTNGLPMPKELSHLVRGGA